MKSAGWQVTGLQEGLLAVCLSTKLSVCLSRAKRAQGRPQRAPSAPQTATAGAFGKRRCRRLSGANFLHSGGRPDHILTSAYIEV